MFTILASFIAMQFLFVSALLFMCAKKKKPIVVPVKETPPVVEPVPEKPVAAAVETPTPTPVDGVDSKPTSKKSKESKKSVKQSSKKQVSKKEDEGPKSVKDEAAELKEKSNKSKKTKSPMKEDGEFDEKKEDSKEKKEDGGDEEKKDDGVEEKKEDEEGAPTFDQATAVQMDVKKELKIEPAELRFSSKGGLCKLEATNNTDNRLAVKVKCSDNDLFRVNPVFSFIEKGAKFNIEVSRLEGNVKPDKLAIVYLAATDEDTDAATMFKAEDATKKQTVTNVSIFIN